MSKPGIQPTASCYFILNYVQICFQFKTRFNKISKDTLFYFVFLCDYHLFKELSLFVCKIQILKISLGVGG